MNVASTHKRYFSVFQLVMMAIISVDSLRNLPIAAQYGFSLVFFYIIAGISFFLPLAWITSRLAVQYPELGGSYVWVEAAFGKKWGSLSIWLLWVYNIIWYPTIFAFIANIIISACFPELVNNRWLNLGMCEILFWGVTFLQFYGIRISAFISVIGAFIGTLFPMLLLMSLATYWLAAGYPSAINFTLKEFIPHSESLKDLAYFSNFLFSLLGLEVIAVHAANVINPQKTYPRALLISAPIILFTLTFSSLALCIVIEPEKIKLLSGIMDVFQLFFMKHFPLGTSIMGWCIVVGCLGIASSWIIGPARALQVALSSTNVSPKLYQLNKKGAPVRILVVQGLIYTLLLSAFLLFPTINSSYWLLSALTAQFALIYYILLFSAAVRLFQLKSQNKTQTLLSFLMPICAGLISLIGIIVGFIPPSDISPENRTVYELFMGTSLALFCILPLIFIKNQNNMKNLKKTKS